MTDKSPLLIGCVAGIACVLMIASAQSAGLAGMPLTLFAPLTIYVAALGWGTQAAIVSSMVAILVAGVAISPGMAIYAGLAFSIPASLAGYQANLAQKSADGTMEWFPLSQIFFNLTLAASAGLVAVGVAVGFDVEALTPPLTELVTEMFKTSPSPMLIGEADLKVFVQKTLASMPFVLGSIWVIVHVLNMHIASRICRAIDKLPRPKDDLPATANLIPAAALVMLLALVGTLLLSGGMQHVAGVFAGAFVTAFSLVGLAALHLYSRKASAGVILKMASYVLIVVFFFPLFVFAISGISRTLNNKQSNPPTGDQS